MVKKTAIISGGTKGLGRATSLALGRAGFSVFSLYSKDNKAAQDLKTQFKNEAIDGYCCKKDALEIPPENEIILINNAVASFEPKPFHKWTEEDFRIQLETTLFLSHELCTKVIPQMVKKRKGTIINILSMAISGVSPKGFSGYSIGKYALLGLSKSLTSEYSSLGIRTFSVLPPIMDTSLTQSWNTLIKQAIVKDNRLEAPNTVAEFILEKIKKKPIEMGEEFYEFIAN